MKTISRLILALVACTLSVTAMAGIPKKFAAPKREAPSVQKKSAVVVPSKTAYGWVTRDRGGVPLGLASFDLSAPTQLTSLFPLADKAFAGAFANGKYYFYRYSDDAENQDLIPLAFSTVDLSTGAVSDIADWSDKAFIMNDMTYDYSTGKMYAIGRAVGSDEILTSLTFEYSFLMSINLNTGVVTVEKEWIDWTTLINPTYLTLAASLDGTLYSVNANGMLVKFDRDNDWSEVVVGPTGLQPGQYLQTMEFDHDTETLYWAADYKSIVSNLAVIDTETGVASVVDNLGTDSRLAGLYIPFTQPAGAAPAAAGNFRAIVDRDGANKVTLLWTNPTKTFDGSDIATLSTVKVVRGSDVVKTFTAPAVGAEMTFVDQTDEPGLYTYSVIATNSAGDGMTAALHQWVGADVPAAVTHLGIGRNDDGSAILQWTEPELGIHNGWIDRSSLGYKITRHPDEVVLATNQKGTEFVDASIVDIDKYSYTVESHNSAGVGAAATSVEISLGSTIAQFPYNCLFEDVTVFNTWTVVNVNGGSTWSWKKRDLKDYACFAMYQYDNANDADDYLISPDLRLKAGHSYELKFNYRGANANYEETFEVHFGQGRTAEAQAAMLKNYTVKTGDGAFSTVQLPEITADGIYNISFRATSPKGRYNIYITDVTITDLGGGTSGGDTGDTDEITAPYNLNAEVDGAGRVTLTWNREVSGTETNIFDDFETYDKWQINPTGKYKWYYIDGDQGIPYGADSEYDAYPNEWVPIAAMIFAPNELSTDVSDANPPYSGDQYLMFKSNYSAGDGSRPAPAPDDYFISPALNFGKDFVFSFYAKADPDLAGQEWGDTDLWNKEKIQVGYSVGGREPSDFVWLTEAPETIRDSWTQKQYTIPGDARYVCIHYLTPENGYLLCVDDVFIGIQNASSQARAARKATFSAFDVYLDDVKVGSTQSTIYDLGIVEEGYHTAKVVSVYEEGESAPVSVAFTIGNGAVGNLQAGVKVYPNPASDYVAFGTSVDRARLLNATGSAVAEASNCSSMSLRGVAKGIYLLQITVAGKISTTKLIVK